MAKSIKERVSNLFSNIMDSIFKRLTASYESVYQRVNYQKSSNSSVTEIINYDSLMSILCNYSLLNTIVNAFYNPVLEVINNKNFKTNNKAFDKYLNDYGIKDYIIKNLHDMIKWGSLVSAINKKEKLVDRLVDEFDYVFVTASNDYIVGAFSEDLNAIEIGNCSLKYDEGLFYYFSRGDCEYITKKDVIKNLGTDKLTTEVKDMDAKIVAISKFRPIGILYPYLKDIFAIYLREYIFDALSVNEYVKSNNYTIGTPSVDSSDAGTNNDIANLVESLLNEDNVTAYSAYSDPMAVIAEINNKLANRFNVVPELQGYSQLQELKVPDFEQLLNKLESDIDKRIKNLSFRIGIPDEAISGNAANHWELIARNSRYAESLSRLLFSITLFVKNFIINQHYAETKEILSYRDIPFNLDTSEYLRPFLNKSKITSLNDRIGDLSTLLQTIANIEELPGIDFSKIKVYLKDELSKADKTLADCINLDKVRKVTNEAPNVQVGGFFSRKSSKKLLRRYKEK